MMQTLRTAGLIVIEGGQLLLAYSSKKQVWYLPGGKVESDESPASALLREIEEELQVRLPESALNFYMHVSAPAYGEQGLQMEQDCFLCTVKSAWQASAEVAAISYFSFQSYKLQDVQVPGVICVFEKLLEDKLVAR